jgi:hypothetical protein
VRYRLLSPPESGSVSRDATAASTTNVVEIAERCLVFARLTLSASINSYFLVVLEVFGDFNNLLAGELGVREPRVHNELIQQEQTDVVIVARLTHLDLDLSYAAQACGAHSHCPERLCCASVLTSAGVP